MEKLNAEELRWLHGALRNVEFLSVMSIGELEKLTGYIFKKTFKAKSTVFKQGDRGDFFYIVYYGSVSVWASQQGNKQQMIATLEPGSYFGETALISNMPRNSTITADNDVVLFTLFKNDFMELVKKNPALEKNIKEVIERRKAQRSMELSSKPPPEEPKGFFSKLFRKS
jgi:putative ABC transport system ATP-binding protein